MLSSDRPDHATTEKWLSIVGIGEKGVAGLCDEAKKLIGGAEIVFGGRRHLELAASLIRGERRPWPSPFDATMRDVVAQRGRSVCVLASGDPFLHGVGATLARHVPAEEMHVLPQASAFSLAAARLGWPLHEVDTLSLHGRDIAYLRPLLHPGRRLLLLTSDGEAPAASAAFLTGLGFGTSGVAVLEALGGPNELVTKTLAAEFDLPAANPLNLLAVEVSADRSDTVIPLAPGLPDSLFDHDGQITKREIRAVTLSALAPRHGELLWDIGAGSGSVAIEWMLRHPSMRAIAVEQDTGRAARIAENARALGVPGLQVVAGRAPKALAGLEPPDALFIGGGGSDPGVVDAAIANLGAGGRLVANAVTLQMEAALIDLNARLGGDLVRLSIGRAAPVGSMTGWRQAMPVTQWVWSKP